MRKVVKGEGVTSTLAHCPLLFASYIVLKDGYKFMVNSNCEIRWKARLYMMLNLGFL